jgi:hypothetical protein
LFARSVLKNFPQTEHDRGQMRTRRPFIQVIPDGSPDQAFAMAVTFASRRAVLEPLQVTHQRRKDGRVSPVLSAQIAPQPLPAVFQEIVGSSSSSTSP